MTVYNLIQSLASYPADSEVLFHLEKEFSADVEAEFDRENEDDTQEVTVDIDFEDDVEFDGVREDFEHNIVIDLV